MTVLWCNDHIAGRGIKFHLITDPPPLSFNKWQQAGTQWKTFSLRRETVQNKKNRTKTERLHLVTLEKHTFVSNYLSPVRGGE